MRLARPRAFTCENKELVFIARWPVTNMARGRDGALCRSGHGAVRYAVLGTAFELVPGSPTESGARVAGASW
jgi:hypothetical protein